MQTFTLHLLYHFLAIFSSTSSFLWKKNPTSWPTWGLHQHILTLLWGGREEGVLPRAQQEGVWRNCLSLKETP